MIDRRLVPARAGGGRVSAGAVVQGRPKKTRPGGRVRKHLPRARDGFLRERAVRMVLDHECEHDSQWAATRSIAAKIGCSARILCHCVRGHR